MFSISVTVFQTEGSSGIKRIQWCSTWIWQVRVQSAPGFPNRFFVEPARKYCVVPSPLSARMAVCAIAPSNLQCFRASDAQSVRVRYTNQTKHAFRLRVAYVYRPKFIKIQYPAPDPNRHPEFNLFPYLINIWWITVRSIYYIYKCKYRYSNIRSIFDPYAATDTDTDAGYRYKYGSRFNVYSMHIWFIFDTGTDADR